MRLLLDSHVVLWLLADQPVAPEARRLVESVDNEVWVSVASIWELEIKQALGKLRFDGDLVASVLAAGLDLMEIRSDHAVLAARLPMHHRDPFDRLLVAQAIHESCSVVTRDAVLMSYGVHIVPA